METYLLIALLIGSIYNMKSITWNPGSEAMKASSDFTNAVSLFDILTETF